ncbi:HPr kinase [Fervidicella metallireducens AeB]|uniref:HPr kinase n=1 Tax=Fervidicella metallireducens AeB TaxID=1403537 RepID=A0A017RWJ8_9CLOT|nr:HPr kinase [Fervidicella metallireducens AeB]
MIEKKIVIQNETGIHARPAGLIVKEASKFKSNISLIKGEKEYNAKSIMSIMTMAAAKGEEIIVKANGEDEETALSAVVELILTGLE